MNSLDHAKHNESVCNYLSKKESFSDWVVITAFYAALHYVREAIIPVTINGKEYDDFDSLFYNLKSPYEGRHGFLKDYTMRNFPLIGYEYCKLHDMSTTARYMNYTYNREEATKAKQYLEKIKEFTINQ